MSFVINGTTLEKYEPDDNDVEELIVPDGIKVIGDSAFSQCTVSRIVLPNSVKKIGNSAFWQSWSNHINIPDGVTEIGKLAFCGNNMLEEINIPIGVKKIGENTFWSCSRVTKIRIPDTIQEVDKSAFEDCRNAFELYNKNGEHITIPFIRDWGKSFARKVVELICASPQKREELFDDFEREELKIPVSLWMSLVDGSAKAADYVKEHAAQACRCLILDLDNFSFLTDTILDELDEDDAQELYQLACSEEAAECAAILNDRFGFPDEEEAEQDEDEEDEDDYAEEDENDEVDSDIPSEPDDEEDTPSYRYIKISGDSIADFIAQNGAPASNEHISVGWDEENTALVLLTYDTKLLRAEISAIMSRVFTVKFSGYDEVDIEDKTNLLFSDAKGKAIIELPVDIKREIITLYNGVMKSYAAYGKDYENAVADYDCGTVKAMSDAPPMYWDDDSIKEFFDLLPEFTALTSCSAKEVSELTLPYTCCSVGDLSEMTCLEKLTLKRRQINIGDDVLSEGLTVVSPSGGPAEELAEENGCTFIACEPEPPVGRVSPSSEWSIIAPDESIWEERAGGDTYILSCVAYGDADHPSNTLFKFFSGNKETEFPPDCVSFYENGSDSIKLAYLHMQMNVFGLFTVHNILPIVRVFINGNCTLMQCSGSNKAESSVQLTKTIYDTLSTMQTKGGTAVAFKPFPEEKVQEIIDGFFDDSSDDDEDENTDPGGIRCDEDTVVNVSDDWEITVPAGYRYSTDHEEIGHRRLVFGLDDGTLDLRAPFDSTVNFTVTCPVNTEDNNGGEPYDPQEQAKQFAFMGNTIFSNSQIAVLMDSPVPNESDSGEDYYITRGNVFTKNATYAFQFFDQKSSSEDESAELLRGILETVTALNKKLAPMKKLEGGKPAPSKLTVAKDWSLTVPDGYLCKTEKDNNEAELLATIQDEAATETWKIERTPTKVSGVDDLLFYGVRMKIEHMVMGPRLSGDNEKEFVLRHESDLNVFCQLKSTSENENGAIETSVFKVQIITLNAMYEIGVRLDFVGTLSEHFERLLRIAGTISSADEKEAPSYLSGFAAMNSDIPFTVPKNSDTLAIYEQAKENSVAFTGIMRMGGVLNDSLEYALEAISGDDAGSFPLSEKAWEAAKLFRMHEEFYDPRSDREQELLHNYIREINYLHLFRSFAWILSEYAEVHGCTLSDIPADEVVCAAQLAGSRKINYDETRFPAICGLRDGTCAYLPDSNKQDYIAKLPEGEGEMGEWKRGSLITLRNELTELYPCIQHLISYLEKRRNSRKPLRGDQSDAVYVWIALTLAASRPFVLTSAPMNYDYDESERPTYEYFNAANGMPALDGNYSSYYSDDDDDDDYSGYEEQREQERLERIAKNRERVEENCEVVSYIPSIKGKTFVATGLESDDEARVKSLIEAEGGFLRQSISGKTDYLIVEPAGMGERKFSDVLAQADKGHTVNVIFYEDFMRSFDEDDDDTAEENTELSNAIGKMKETIAQSTYEMNKFLDIQKQQLEKKERRKQENLELQKNLSSEVSETDITAAKLYATLLYEEADDAVLSNDAFCSAYEEDFPELEADDLAALRDKVRADRNDPAKAEAMERVFRSLPYDVRLMYSVKNAMNMYSYKTDESVSDFAERTASRWFTSEELPKLRSDIAEHTVELRNQMDMQLSMANSGWKKFYSAKPFLTISLFDEDMPDFDPDNRFMVDCTTYKAAVQLATSGLMRMSLSLSNYFPLYWGIDCESIWEAAYLNAPYDRRSESGDDAKKLAEQAFRKVVGDRPVSKPVTLVFEKTVPKAEPEKAVTSAPVAEDFAPKKKEGCYIATAVYGSYDAPEVMVLRRFRDEVLKKSILGRAFIKVYYTLSPPAARWLRNTKHINAAVRRILDKWVEKLK